MKQMTNKIFLLFLLTLMRLGTAWSQTHTEQYDYDGDGVDETYNVVYLNLGNGDDSKAGDTQANAVKTWAKAYSKLPAYTGTTDADRDAAWDKNIIVVCEYSGANGILKITDGNTGNRPVTITGVWPWTADNTTAAKVKTGGGVFIDNAARIGADTKFKYLRFGGSANAYLQMFLHDATFDVGCTMTDENTDLNESNGAIKKANGTLRKAPDLQVFLFANANNFSQSKTDGGWNALMKKKVTLTIRSGQFGRIISSRIQGTTDNDIKNRYVIGNPSNPFLCVINVDMDPATTTSEWNPKKYDDDIAFLCAGMTQGTEYADVQFNIKRAKIATFVGAMQGMSIKNTSNTSVKLSNSSFFGRTITNLIPDNDADLTIYRFFAACLGRSMDSQTGIVNAAFYGQSILNMYGGTIENGVFVSAGGISGLQSPDGRYHTTDEYIPYLDNTDAYKNYPYMGIKYQPYDADKTMPKFTSSMYKSNEVIDLANTVTTLNIYGGTINGGLYGGSYGYSSDMKVAMTMAGAGSLWGETNVNIYGGTINGGVYGGGGGSTEYYNAADNKKKADFLTVATVYGNTNVNIYGGNIAGNIYGGGAGVAATGAVDTDTEFLNIAKVYGTTNVTINPTAPNWTFNHNIYGGGALGAVEGTTNVKILGGTINGNVFGAGQGEEGHPNKAKVTGDTNVTIGEEPPAP